MCSWCGCRDQEQEFQECHKDGLWGCNETWAANDKIKMCLEAPASSPTTAEVGTEQINPHLQYFPVIPCRTGQRALTPSAGRAAPWRNAFSPACLVSNALHAHRLWVISSLRNEPRLKIAACCLLPAHRGRRSLEVLAVIFNVEMFRSQNCLASPASMGSSGDSWRADSGVWFSLHPGLEGEGKELTLETTSPFSVPALTLCWVC